MFKVLIADDEPKILHGLSQKIQKMGLDIQVAGLARDGVETYEMARALRPDILLLDICMPFMNGLDIMEKINALNLSMKVIVITGHEEFEYARKALELSVDAYLLKPVEIRELKTRLLKVIQSLTTERKDARLRDYAADQLMKRKDFLAEVFLRDVIREEYSSDEIEAYCGQLGINPGLDYDLVLILDTIENHMNSANEFYLRYEVEGAAKELAACTSSYLFPDGRGNMLWMYDRGCMSNARLAERLPEMLTESLKSPLRFESVAVPSLDRLPEAYEQVISKVFDGSQTSRFVADAQGCIARDYGNPDLNLVQVAEQVGISPTYLSRLMKQELGLSFSKYLTKTRIKHAIKLINQGLLLKDIAPMVGYYSPYYFSTAFKRVIGTAPIEYRKSGAQQ